MTEILPSVSVVIPAKPDSVHLPNALASIADQDYENVSEVVVACSDVSALNVPDWVTVVANPPGTTPAGLNQAIAASSGEVIVRCDAHSVLPPDYVTIAVETLLATGAEVVGGMQVPVGETKWEVAIADAMSSRLGAGDARYRVGGEAGPAETVYLGVFRRTALEAVGGYDETFLRNQDYELNHRIIEAGGSVWFDPRMRVRYRPRGSLGTLARQYFDYGRGKRRFARKHPGMLRVRQLAPSALVVVLVSAVLAIPFGAAAALIPIGYLLAVLLFSGLKIRVALAVVTMHVSWGVGFLSATR